MFRWDPPELPAAAWLRHSILPPPAMITRACSHAEWQQPFCTTREGQGRSAEAPPLTSPLEVCRNITAWLRPACREFETLWIESLACYFLDPSSGFVIRDRAAGGVKLA